MSHKVIFIHGFGVMKNFRSMFTNISDELEKYGVESISFDLNQKDEEGDIHVNPFSKQLEIVKEIFEKEIGENTDGDIIDIVCHSQGCMIGSMADLLGIRKTLFLAPATENSNKKSMKYFSQNPATVMDPEGESRIAKKDGTAIVIQKEFFEEKELVDIESVYKNYIDKNECVVVKANQDQVVSNDNLEKLFEGTKIFDLDGNHSFDGEARQSLVELVKKELI